jgi:hypothetical protein
MYLPTFDYKVSRLVYHLGLSKFRATPRKVFIPKAFILQTSLGTLWTNDELSLWL